MTGPTEIRLDEAMDKIVDHVVQVCDTDRTAPGGLLTDLTRVVSGSRSRVRPDAPYLWVMLGAATATNARALHERWDAALMLNAYVSSEDPQDGWMDALRFAARARSVVLRDRSLGDQLPFIEDTQSAEIGVLGQFPRGRRFGAYARINVSLALLEPSEESS